MAHKSIGGTTNTDDDIAQGAVIHIDDALPRNTAWIDIERITVINMVINHRGQQIVSQGNRGEIAGEMQVDVFHRYDLGIAATSCTAFDTEHGAERWFAQTDHGFFTDAI